MKKEPNYEFFLRARAQTLLLGLRIAWAFFFFFFFFCPTNPITFNSVSMGLTVSRQTAKNLTVNRQKRGNFTDKRQTKKLWLYIKRFLRSFKPHYFSCSSRTAGSQRIVLIGTASFHVYRYTHFMVFSTHLLLNWHYNRLLSVSKY